MYRCYAEATQKLLESHAEVVRKFYSFYSQVFRFCRFHLYRLCESHAEVVQKFPLSSMRSSIHVTVLMFVVVIVVYFIFSRLLYLSYSANLGLLYIPHPGMGPLV